MSNPTNGRLDFDLADYQSGDGVTSYRVRDQLIGNALHCTDMSAYQHAINWMSCASGFSAVQATWTAPCDDINQWFLVRSVRGLHVPVHEDGTVGGIHVRLYAASANAGASIDFAVMVGELGAAVDPTLPTTVQFTATASTTPGWLTVASGSQNLAPDLSLLLPSVSSRSVLRADGSSSAVEMIEPAINIYQRTTNKAFSGIVYGFHAHAFRGTP